MNQQSGNQENNTLTQGRETINNDERILRNKVVSPEDKSGEKIKIVNEQEQGQIVNQEEEDQAPLERMVEKDDDPNVNQHPEDADKIDYSEEWNKNKPPM